MEGKKPLKDITVNLIGTGMCNCKKPLPYKDFFVKGFTYVFQQVEIVQKPCYIVLMDGQYTGEGWIFSPLEFDEHFNTFDLGAIVASLTK